MIRLFEAFKKGHSFPFFFWKGRGSTKVYLGYGERKTSPFMFKAQAFHTSGCEGIWKDFPHEWNFSPDQLIASNWVPMTGIPHLPRCIRREDTPSFEQWWHLVSDIGQKIQQDEFTKIALARRTTLTFDAPINPHELLKGLMAFGDHTSLFMVQLDPHTAFLGASPEKLFSRLDRKILTEALAGTINQTERWSPKELAEVEAVRVYLQERLLPCCQDLHWKPFEERPFGNLKHLYQKLEGLLKAKISDAMLISQLHPTPAVGGFPRDITLQYLRSVEPFERGWYGAPIGLISEMETDLAVAIRSMLVRGHEVHIFSGAGIVKGSVPLKEWEELDRKIAHVMRWCHE